jgi:hypothetical protein
MEHRASVSENPGISEIMAFLPVIRSSFFSFAASVTGLGFLWSLE